LVDTTSALGIYNLFPVNYLTTGSMRLLCGIMPSLCEAELYFGSDGDLSVEVHEKLQVYLN